MIDRFITGQGLALQAIDVGTMRKLDRLAIDSAGLSLLQMMENAGRDLAELTLEMLGDAWRRARVVVLAGPGNNGGGGLCAGRHLANKGLKVAFYLANEVHLGEAAALQRRLLIAAGGRQMSLNAQGAGPADVVLDAVIGYGLNGAPTGEALDLIRRTNAFNATVIALDVPSGIDASSGAAPGEYVSAETTLTLAWPKTGLLPDATGKLWLGDIGIPPSVYLSAGIDFEYPFGNRYIIPLKAAEA